MKHGDTEVIPTLTADDIVAASEPTTIPSDRRQTVSTTLTPAELTIVMGRKCPNERLSATLRRLVLRGATAEIVAASKK